MNKKKWLSMLLLLVLVVMTACSSTSTNSGEQKVDDKDANKNADKNEAGGSKSAKITVTFMASGTYDAAAEETADQLKAQGIEATVAAFPWATLREKNTTDLISKNNNYDVMSGSYYLADVYEHFGSLDEFIDKDQFGKGLLDGLMEKSEHVDGKQIGIPYGADAYGIMYRTDLFEGAGISVPKTWSEFQAAINTLQDKYGKDGISPYVFAGGATEQLPGLFFSRYEGYFIDKNGKYALDESKALVAIKESMAHLKSGPDNLLSLGLDEANAVFMDGKAAILEGWPSFIRVTADDPAKSKIAGKWAVAPYPGNGLVWLSLWQMYMPKETKNKDAAWEWMKTYSGENNDKHFFETYGLSPIYTSTYEDSNIVNNYGHYFNGVKENLKRAQNPPLSGESQDYLAAILGDIFTNKVTPEKGLVMITEKWISLEVPAPLLETGKRNDQVEK